MIFPLFKKKGFKKISIGELIKNEGLESKYKKEIEDCILNKKEINSGIVLDLIKEKFNSDKSQKKYLISGFPRSEHNSQEWKKEMKNCKIIALIYVTYNRKEYEVELNERKSKGDGKSLDHNEAMKRYDDFLKETTKVFDDFGIKKLIRVSSQLADNLIVSNISHNSLISDL